MPDYVSTLISSGLDAFTNLYDIEISLPTLLTAALPTSIRNTLPTDVPALLKLRVQDFQGPQPKLAQYQTDYQTIQITRPAPMMEFDRRFDLNFRLDTNYVIYHVLKQWSFLYHDALNGGINLPHGKVDNGSLLGSMRVSAYTPNTMETALLWGYDGMFCNKVTDPPFTRAGTEPITITASFMFFEYLPTNKDINDKQLQGDLVS